VEVITAILFWSMFQISIFVAVFLPLAAGCGIISEFSILETGDL